MSTHFNDDACDAVKAFHILVFKVLLNISMTALL
jgi:hypothetical protein